MSQIETRSENIKNRQRRKSRQQLSTTQVMFAVILAIALMLAVQFSSRITSERNLNQIRDTVQDEIAFLQNEQSELIQDLDFVQSDAYVEQWARAEGRMVRDDMVLVIPVQSSQILPEETTEDEAITLPDTLDLQTTLPDPDPWQLWWALFFDMPAPQIG